MATCRRPMKAAISSKRSDVISTLAYVHTRGRHTMPPSLQYGGVYFPNRILYRLWERIVPNGILISQIKSFASLHILAGTKAEVWISG
jgi:hypothetical protein